MASTINHKNLDLSKFLAKPRAMPMLNVIYQLVGIWECLECCNIILPPSYNKPLMCCGGAMIIAVG